MIKILQGDRYSIVLEIDVVGCNSLLNAYQEAAQNSECTQIAVTLDKNIFSRSLGLIETDIIIIRSNDEELLVFEDNVLTLSLDLDSINYGIERFSEGLTKGYIFPAELCDISVAKKRNDVTLYCILNNENKSVSFSIPKEI